MEKPVSNPQKGNSRPYQINNFSFLEFSDMELFPASEREGWYLSASSCEELSAPPPVHPAGTNNLQNGKRFSRSLRPEAMLGYELHASSDSDMPLRAKNDEPEKAPEQEEYMSGFKLWLMLLSLIFSIFLIALDMVSFSSH